VANYCNEFVIFGNFLPETSNRQHNEQKPTTGEIARLILHKSLRHHYYAALLLGRKPHPSRSQMNVYLFGSLLMAPLVKARTKKRRRR